MNVTEGVEGAMLSALSYSENEDTLLRRHPDAVIIHRENARAVIIDRPDVTDIIFAGSDDYKDWWGNAWRGKEARGGIGRVYDGVADYYGLLRDGIRRAIKDDFKPHRLFGHSLGGAAAEMYAARRTVHGRPVAALHTFGSPMVGDADFAAVSAQIENGHNWWIPGDVVPYQPKLGGIIPLGYRRAREPYVIEGIRVTREIPFWTPPLLRWVRKGMSHASHTGYYEALLTLERAMTP